MITTCTFKWQKHANQRMRAISPSKSQQESDWVHFPQWINVSLQQTSRLPGYEQQEWPWHTTCAVLFEKNQKKSPTLTQHANKRVCYHAYSTKKKSVFCSLQSGGLTFIGTQSEHIWSHDGRIEHTENTMGRACQCPQSCIWKGNSTHAVHGNNSQLSLPSAALYPLLYFNKVSLFDTCLDSSWPKPSDHLHPTSRANQLWLLIPIL